MIDDPLTDVDEVWARGECHARIQRVSLTVIPSLFECHFREPAGFSVSVLREQGEILGHPGSRQLQTER